MNFLSKKTIIGVAITPNIGLEVAQIDYGTRTVIKYVSKPMNFDKSRNVISDMDIFKDTLFDALQEIGAPKGAELVVSIPATVFSVNDLPASLDANQISMSIEEALSGSPIFQNMDDIPHYTFAKLSNSTIQMSKIAYAASPKTMVVELAIQIKDLGYKLVAIDTSMNSCLNALVYTRSIDVAPDSNWVMLVVDDNSIKVVPMQGRNYVDCFEERISIGEVLGDAENYKIVADATNGIISRTPSQLLYVISKTDLISAKVLADKLIYNAQIVHLDANAYSSQALLELAPDINPNVGKLISPDVIGASVRFAMLENPTASMNMFNKELGDVYLSQAPLTFNGIELTIPNMVVAGIIFALICAGIVFGGIKTWVDQEINKNTEEIRNTQEDINKAKKFIEDNAAVSSSTFDVNDEIRIGVSNNKTIYSYYTIVGTEIPQKLWLTALRLGKHTIIDGQADNLESVYSFYRNIKDYDPASPMKLDKLALAGGSMMGIGNGGELDTESILSSLNADYYEFRISDGATPDNDSNESSKNGLEDVPDGDLN